MMARHIHELQHFPKTCSAELSSSGEIFSRYFGGPKMWLALMGLIAMNYSTQTAGRLGDKKDASI